MEALRVNFIRHTDDFDTMRHFYEHVLGMQAVSEWDHPGNRGVLLSPGAAYIEILSLGDAYRAGAPPPANIELSIEIDDADALHDRLAAAGVRIMRGLEDAPWGHRSFGIDDPGGMRVWFYHEINGSNDNKRG